MLKNTWKQKQSTLRSVACAAAVTLALTTGTHRALATTTPPPVTPATSQYFDWLINTTGSYRSSPFLSDKSAHSVDAFLKTFSANTPLAVKITAPISDATAQLIFNNSNYHVSYVFGDFENPNAPSELSTLRTQIQYVNAQSGAEHILQRVPGQLRLYADFRQ